MAEQFVNGSRTPYLLNSACLATDTVLTLQGTQGMPATGTFRCQLGYEIVQVTAVNSPLPNQVTVVRGSEASIAAPQPAGTPFQPCLSAAGMAQFKSDILVAAGVAPTTVVALSSYAPTATQQSIQLYAYSTPGDGGGGTFVWNPTDTRAADGGTIIAVTGIATGRWNRVNPASDVKNAHHFGAVGDGVTDDAAALSLAIAALGEGDELVLPKTIANVYLIKSPLHVSSAAGQNGIVMRGLSRAIDGTLPSFQTTIRAAFTPPASGTTGTIASLGADGNGVQVLTITGLAGVNAASIGDSIQLSGCRVTTTAANFTQPAVGHTVIVQVTNNDWIAPITAGGIIQIAGGGIYYVNAANVDGIHITVTNSGGIGNASPTATVNSGATVTPGLWGDAANNTTFTITSFPTSSSVTAVASFYEEATGALINTGTDGNNGSIHWVVKQPMLRLYSRECSIERLMFDGNNTVGPCIDSNEEAGGLNNTANKFIDCSFQRAIFGVKIGDTGPQGQFFGNCDNHRLDHCTFNTMAHSGVNAPNQTGQSKSHESIDCTYLSVPYGWWQKYGSATIKGGGCGAVTCSLVWFGASGEPLVVAEQDCEDAARVFVFSQVQNGSARVSAIRCDYSVASKMAPDGMVVLYNPENGGLRVESSLFYANHTGGETICIGVPGVSGQSSYTAVVENCVFGRTDVDICKALGGSEGTYLSIGNSYSTTGTSTAIQSGVRRSRRFDLADATYIVPYASTPVVLQAISYEADRVAGYSWNLVNGANNNLPAIPNTLAILETSSGAPSAGFSVTGVVPIGCAPTQKILNLTGQTMTIANASASSSAANRIFTSSGADVACKAFEMVYISGAGLTSGWYEMSHS